MEQIIENVLVQEGFKNSLTEGRDYYELSKKSLLLCLMGDKLGIKTETYNGFTKYVNILFKRQLQNIRTVLYNNKQINSFLGKITENDFKKNVTDVIVKYSPKVDYSKFFEMVSASNKKTLVLNLFSKEIADYILKNNLSWQCSDSLSSQNILLYHLFCLYIGNEGASQTKNNSDSILLLNLYEYSNVEDNEDRTQLRCLPEIPTSPNIIKNLMPCILNFDNVMFVIPNNLMHNCFWNKKLVDKNGNELRKMIVEFGQNCIVWENKDNNYCFVHFHRTQPISKNVKFSFEVNDGLKSEEELEKNLYDYPLDKDSLFYSNLLPSFYTMYKFINQQLIKEVKYCHASACKGKSNDSNQKIISADYSKTVDLSEVLAFGVKGNEKNTISIDSALNVLSTEIDKFDNELLNCSLVNENIKGPRRKALFIFISRAVDMIRKETLKKSVWLHPQEFLYLLKKVTIPNPLISNPKFSKMYIDGIANKKIQNLKEIKNNYNKIPTEYLGKLKPLLNLLVKYKYFTANEKQNTYEPYNDCPLPIKQPKVFYRAILCLLCACCGIKVFTGNNNENYFSYRLKKDHIRSMLENVIIDSKLKSREQQFKKDIRSYINKRIEAEQHPSFVKFVCNFIKENGFGISEKAKNIKDENIENFIKELSIIKYDIDESDICWTK